MMIFDTVMDGASNINPCDSFTKLSQIDIICDIFEPS
jgi:hypothetical protein